MFGNDDRYIVVALYISGSTVTPCTSKFDETDSGQKILELIRKTHEITEQVTYRGVEIFLSIPLQSFAFVSNYMIAKHERLINFEWLYFEAGSSILKPELFEKIYAKTIDRLQMSVT